MLLCVVFIIFQFPHVESLGTTALSCYTAVFYGQAAAGTSSLRNTERIKLILSRSRTLWSSLNKNIIAIYICNFPRVPLLASYLLFGCSFSASSYFCTVRIQPRRRSMPNNSPWKHTACCCCVVSPCLIIDSDFFFSIMSPGRWSRSD